MKLIITFILAASLYGQAPPPELFLYWRVDGVGTPWQWKKVVIDSSLKLSASEEEAVLSAQPQAAQDPAIAARITALETELAKLRADVAVASQAEAEAGLVTTKLMTPESTLQSFMSWNPIPSYTTKPGAFLGNDGGLVQWTYKLINAPSGTQPLTNAASVINPDRFSVRVNPTSNLTLGDGSNPVIVDGEDGQYLSICNVSTAMTVTLADEAVVANTNLRLSGVNLPIRPRGCALLQFVQPLSAWVSVMQPSGTPPPPVE
jgi:hypothetical protein